MSDMKDPTIKLLGKSIQSASDQQRQYFNGSKAFRYEVDPGKKAYVNLRANPAAMCRSLNFHETS